VFAAGLLNETIQQSFVEIAQGARAITAIPAHGHLNVPNQQQTNWLFLQNGSLFSGGYKVSFSGVEHDVSMVAGSHDHLLVLLSNGSVLATGDNYYGQLGDGTSRWLADGTSRNVKSQLSVTMDGVQAISAYRRVSFFLTSDGTALQFGENIYYLKPYKFNYQNCMVEPHVAMTGVQAIATSGTHVLFLSKNGTVYGAGMNDAGQLGDRTKNTPYRKYMPTKSTLTDIQAIAAGDSYSLFLAKNGTVFFAGSNTQWKFGHASVTSNALAPTKQFEGAQAIAAGSWHVMILAENGTCYAAGSNERGQLGIGSQDRWAKQFQAVMTNVQAIAAGLWSSLVLTN